jgi:hypothetical protein
MIALALVAAAFAWWWNVNRGRNALDFYGAEAATLIRSAPTVEIFVRPTPADRGASGSDAPQASSSTRQIDISRAPGLLNARASLLDDASYVWDRPPPAASPGPYVLIRFVDKGKQVMLRLEFDSRSLSLVPEGRQTMLVEKTAEGWRSFVSRNAQSEPAPQPH